MLAIIMTTERPIVVAASRLEEIESAMRGSEAIIRLCAASSAVTDGGAAGTIIISPSPSSSPYLHLHLHSHLHVRSSLHLQHHHHRHLSLPGAEVLVGVTTVQAAVETTLPQPVRDDHLCEEGNLTGRYLHHRHHLHLHLHLHNHISLPGAEVLELIGLMTTEQAAVETAFAIVLPVRNYDDHLTCEGNFTLSHLYHHHHPLKIWQYAQRLINRNHEKPSRQILIIMPGPPP